MKIIGIIISISFGVIFCAIFGYVTKAANESKGYKGGFWLGAILQPIGLLIVAFKKDLPNAKPNAFRPYPVVNVLKKYHYPAVSPLVEPIDILKGEIHAEAEATKVNLVWYIIHGLFMIFWYGVVLGIYLWYCLFYTIRWILKYRSNKSGSDNV